ncbi:MAG: aminodeoxychorismate synthase, partial [Adhaeribacter sp.]|nr:aminodeoxychorismate synthase [Adhaeribacter sp.]
DQSIMDKVFREHEIAEPYPVMGGYAVHTTPQTAKELASLGFIKRVEIIKDTAGYADPAIFPFMPLQYKWNKDNFGPLYIPKEGDNIKLDSLTIPLYETIIRRHEGNKNVEVKANTITIDGKVQTSYTFKQNYYFMMGDNRHNSADSRYWGFVPADHIVGKAVLIWMSSDPNGGVSGKIRWDRIFNLIH